jgi:hypothetical protein
VTDWRAVAHVLAGWWKRDADPVEVVPIRLGVEWDGTPEQLVEAAIRVTEQDDTAFEGSLR